MGEESPEEQEVRVRNPYSRQTCTSPGLSLCNHVLNVLCVQQLAVILEVSGRR